MYVDSCQNPIEPLPGSVVSCGPPPPAPARPRLQFGLKTLLVLTTGLALFFSLASWRLSEGTVWAIVVVSSWWTWLARRTGRRRLAYYLAGFAIGAILIAPFTIISLLGFLTSVLIRAPVTP